MFDKENLTSNQIVSENIMFGQEETGIFWNAYVKVPINELESVPKELHAWLEVDRMYKFHRITPPFRSTQIH